MSQSSKEVTGKVRFSGTAEIPSSTLHSGSQVDSQWEAVQTAAMKEGRDYSPKIDPLREICPVRAALDVLTGRWKPSILWQIRDGTRRFSDLQCALSGISAQALTVQLRQLEADGVVERTIHPEIPPRVEYGLTDHGLSLTTLMAELENWGTIHLERQGKAAADPCH